jgi:protein-disulfide isomerase
MFHFFCLARPVPTPPSRTRLFLGLAAALLVAAACAHAQFAVPSAGTQVLDTTALHPPAGERVAIVEFADMECPACARANPVIKEAAAKYKIPWIRHDFIIPYHTWSPIAALNARWFDSVSKALGGEYRDQVFANQSSIYNPDQLRQFTQKFADEHKIKLPFAMDPQGKLADAIKADSELGRRTGVTQTPTVFVVTSNSKGAPFIEVQHPDTQLFQVIDRALADTASPAKPAPKATPAKKPAAKVAPAQTPAAK